MGRGFGHHGAHYRCFGRVLPCRMWRGSFVRREAGGGRERPWCNSEVRDGVLGHLRRELRAVFGGQPIVEAGLPKRGLELRGNTFTGGRLSLRRSLLGGGFGGGCGWVPYWLGGGFGGTLPSPHWLRGEPYGLGWPPFGGGGIVTCTSVRAFGSVNRIVFKHSILCQITCVSWGRSAGGESSGRAAIAQSLFTGVKSLHA